MDQLTLATYGCAGCRHEVPVEGMRWYDGHAWCDDCYDRALEPPPVSPEPITVQPRRGRAPWSVAGALAGVMAAALGLLLARAR